MQWRRYEFNLWVGKIYRRREWLTIPVFLLGEFHRQRSLVGYNPWGHKESDMIKWLSFIFHICVCVCSVTSDVCGPMDCSPTGSSVHGISQARILKWVAKSYSRGSSWPRDRTASLIGKFLPLAPHRTKIYTHAYICTYIYICIYIHIYTPMVSCQSQHHGHMTYAVPFGLILICLYLKILNFWTRNFIFSFLTGHHKLM